MRRKVAPGCAPCSYRIARFFVDKHVCLLKRGIEVLIFHLIIIEILKEMYILINALIFIIMTGCLHWQNCNGMPRCVKKKNNNLPYGWICGYQNLF